MHDKSEDSLEAALRIAAQKYGGKVDITGSSAFRERAARQAVRLGMTVANADLQAIVADERQRLAAERAPAPPARTEPPAQQRTHPAPEPPRPAPARTYSRPELTQYSAGASILSWLPPEGWDALEAAGSGRPLSARERALLTDPARTVLIDERNQLNDMGRAAYASLQAKMEQERKESMKYQDERQRRSGEGVSPESVNKSAPLAAQAAPEQARPELPEKQATAPASMPAVDRTPSVQRKRDKGRGR
jgi:hypothetical protein